MRETITAKLAMLLDCFVIEKMKDKYSSSGIVVHPVIM